MMQRHVVVFFMFLLVVAACGGTSPGATDEPTPAGTNSNGATDDDSGQSVIDRPEITIASAFLPGTLDPAIEGYTLVQRGIGETLTRVAHDQSIEPWLAESVEHVEGAEWEIVLRENVTFWNGETLTSQHVVEAIERNWEEQPASAGYLPLDTDLEVVDGHTLRMTLPEPDSGLPHNLAAPQLVMHKMDGDGAVMTGPYQPATLRADDELTLEAFDDYWDGAPPLAGVTIRRVPDSNARELAVQSGEVDIMTEASPEGAAVAAGDTESVTMDSTRVHFLMMNHNQTPFDDPAVREAVNLAVDRDELNEVALGGLGAPTTTIIPPELGIDTPAQLELDVAQAEAILDEAGWETSTNGTRARDGEPLEVLLYSYPGRPELTPMAVSIQDQLSRIGFDVSVQEVDDIASVVDGTDFQAAMYSLNMLPTGDAFYALQTIAASDGGNNYGNYENAEFDDVLQQIRVAETDDERADLILDAQQMLLDDHAAAFLISAPRAVIYRPDRLQEPDLHPSEMYFIQTDLLVPAS